MPGALPSAAAITTPEDHGAILHPDGRRGVVALARKMPTAPKPWHEGVVNVADLPDVLPVLAGEDDVYLSVQRFWGWRRIAQLAEAGALFVDVDYHKRPELRDMHPLGVLEDCLTALERARIPAPSMAIGSGRGLYLLWLHDPVPRRALPRWNACQKEIWRVLQPFGADSQALDSARVLRVVGTRHSGAGVVVENLRGPGETWSFEDLAEEILPLDRGELADLRIQRAARAAKRPQKRPKAPPQGFTPGTLWEARLADLQALRRLRWFGPLPPGQRNAWMLVAGVAMSWLAIPPVLRRELYALAREVAGWDDRESRSRLQAVMSRAHAAAKGQRVEYDGLQLDPRYRFRTQTILERLEITAEEERQMLTLIGEDERRRRDRERDRERRRRAGAMSREQYQATAAERRREAHRLRSEGLTHKAIAARLEIGRSTVSKLLKSRPEGVGESPSGCMGGVAGSKSPAEGGIGAKPLPGGVLPAEPEIPGLEVSS